MTHSVLDDQQASNYNVIMLTKLIKIGNSRGVRIPKSILDQLGFIDELDMSIKDNTLILKPVSPVRIGWDRAFQQETKNDVDDDDTLLEFQNTVNDWDRQEWEWEWEW